MVELKNEQLSIAVSEKGAELQSIKDANGKEYLWQGDPTFWPRRSPIRPRHRFQAHRPRRAQDYLRP